MLHAEQKITDPVQQTGVTFAIEGEVMAALERKLDEDQLNAAVEHFSSQEASVAQIIRWMKISAIPDEVLESIGNELKAYEALVASIEHTKPIIAQLGKGQKELNLQKDSLALAQSEEEKKSLGDKIQSLNDKIEKEQVILASGLKHVRYEDIERLDGVFEVLAYSDEQRVLSGSYISEYLRLNKKVETLQAIRQSIKYIEKDIKDAQKLYSSTRTPQEKQELDSKLKELSARKSSLTSNFSNISSGLDYEELFNKKAVKSNFQADLIEMFSPILNEVKALSEKPRRMEAMKKEQADYQSKLEKIALALGNIERVAHHNTDPVLKTQLDELAGYWQQKNRELASLNEATQRKIDTELAKEVPMATAIKEAVSSFFKERGQHLFFSILAFILIYMLFQFFQRLFYKYNPLRKKDEHMVWANLADLSFSVLTFVASIGAMLIVLYLSGDWLILSIVGLIFVGLAWAARNTLPQYVEQIKLLLNFGTVRHGELLVYDGIPYEVAEIGMYTYLSNPRLTGGSIRLPIKDLIGMRSRAFDPEKELLFPCQKGDWILMNDSRLRVIEQTPQYVELDYYGSPEPIQTAKFLGQHIRNLSTRPFWAGIMFHVNFEYRAHFSDMCEKIKAALEQDMKKRGMADKVLRYWVELDELSDSAMGIRVWLQVTPDVAGKYTSFRMWIAQTLMMLSAKEDWEIPYPQLLLHHSNHIDMPDQPRSLPE